MLHYGSPPAFSLPVQLDVSAPASLQPLAELSLAPPADAPETVDTAANFQPEPEETLEPDNVPDCKQDTDLNQALTEEDVDEKQEKEIPLNEVQIIAS